MRGGEMKDKSIKISCTTKICIIIIVFLLIALIAVCYWRFIEDTDDFSNEIVTNKTSTIVPTSELVTLYYEADNIFFYAYIEDGYLYYFKDDTRSFTSSNSENMQKYEDLCDIKKMKTFNLGTGVNPVPFLITEEGQVFCVNFDTDNGIDVEIYEELKDYKIEDILDHSGEWNSVFEILLKDGTTTTVTVGGEDR